MFPYAPFGFGEGRETPFLPVLDSRLPHGICGEDIAFFLAAEKGGARFVVDPQVRVEHLKYVTVQPVLPDEGAPADVTVACMMRVKNEARWISRVIESVKPLCGEKIFVMDDGSTDDTAALALSAGAKVFESPFVGLPLDEVRDKNFLLAHVRAECNPDWILAVDGDEELEQGGCEKILAVLRTNPYVDCFGLRILFLWDSVDQIRVDRRFSTTARQSLFRALPGYDFKSYYEGTPGGVTHSGLHCSNAPFQMRTAPLNVFLLHYGYLFKDDRIRKYRWYTRIDPNNQCEDHYRHSVQGDIPEVSADAILKWAGPLELRKLPARLVPRFDVLPGPLADEEKVMELAEVP